MLVVNIWYLEVKICYLEFIVVFLGKTPTVPLSTQEYKMGTSKLSGEVDKILEGNF